MAGQKLARRHPAAAVGLELDDSNDAPITGRNLESLARGGDHRTRKIDNGDGSGWDRRTENGTAYPRTCV